MGLSRGPPPIPSCGRTWRPVPAKLRLMMVTRSSASRCVLDGMCVDRAHDESEKRAFHSLPSQRNNAGTSNPRRPNHQSMRAWLRCGKERSNWKWSPFPCPPYILIPCEQVSQDPSLHDVFHIFRTSLFVNVVPRSACTRQSPILSTLRSPRERARVNLQRDASKTLSRRLQWSRSGKKNTPKKRTVFGSVSCKAYEVR